MLFKTSTIAAGNMSFRFGSVPNVLKNRTQFLEKHSLSYTNCVPMICSHGDKIVPVFRHSNQKWFGPTTPKAAPKAEALITNEPNITLLLLTADCLPTAFYDPIQNVTALAHLNRKTIAHDLGQKTIRFMEERYGSTPKDIVVKIGPHIKKESYRFPIPLTEPTPPQLLGHTEVVAGQITIDLTSAEIEQLTAVGVMKKNISVTKIDTATSDKYFSHYRSRNDPHYPEGRMATILAITT